MDFLFRPAYTLSSCFEMLKIREPRKQDTPLGGSGPGTVREGTEIFPISSLIRLQR
jgi:hypothetical protein